MFKNVCVIAVVGLVSGLLLPAHAQAPIADAGVTLEVTLDNRESAHYSTFISDITIKNPYPFTVDVTEITLCSFGSERQHRPTL